MTLPPVCILTAGRGSRMGPQAAYLNKALLPLGKMAAISHIIAAFPASTEFVIGVGFLARQVRDYLELAHPDVPFKFVDVPNYDGPGSGPGLSLLACREHLQRPFYFVSSDTIWEEPVPGPSGNWLGVARVSGPNGQYCNVRVDHGRIRELHDKVPLSGEDARSFVGLCFIEDFDIFWRAITSDRQIAGEHQISNGLAALIEHSVVESRDIIWTDLGDHAKYERAAKQFEEFDFGKSNEALYIVEDRVVKFFADPAVVSGRITRARLHPSVFPEIVAEREQFYAYAYAPGRTLYSMNSPSLFGRLLSWLEQELWTPSSVTPDEMRRVCRKFYRDKTLDRARLYDDKHPRNTQPLVVNGCAVPPIESLLERVPWSLLEAGEPVFIHGDLQFDNIICDEHSKRFLLLDWRQEFAGEVAYGDLYYDLAKLYGGILLSYDYIKQNLFMYHEQDQTAFFDFAQRYSTPEYRSTLEAFILGRGWSLAKVRLLVPLIYINMAPLHTEPFDKLLHAYGRLLLWRELSGDERVQ